MEKSDIKQVTTKGFSSKWWRDHRASACSGSGVAKALDALTQRAVPPTGLPTKTKLEYAADLIPLYTTLLTAFTKAAGKCGKLQKETAEALSVYKKQANKGLDMAEQMARDWDASQGKGGGDDKAAKAAAKALSQIDQTIDKFGKILGPIPKATAQADKALKSVVASYINSLKKEGAKPESQKHVDACNNVMKSIKYDAHVKAILSGNQTLSKLNKAFKTVDKKVADPKAYPATAKMLQTVAGELKEMNKRLTVTGKLHKDSVGDILGARPEGG